MFSNWEGLWAKSALVYIGRYDGGGIREPILQIPGGG